MKITLSLPVEIEGDWEYSWYDSAHQHFLLLHDGYFYLLSYHDAAPTPKLFAHIRDLPQNLLCGRVSLDKKLVAIQVSLSSLFVIDIASKKKWVVDIKYPSDNAILPGGVIWSEHGGNSEDLVLATSRGLELHKVSQMRGQCKLSRVVSQHVSSFWYNAEHRMIMLATHAQARQNQLRNPQSVFFTPDERPKEMLLIDGYFLNCERPSIPMLELPPPDKVPRLEVGPGLTVDDVALVSIYGKILCLVRYVEHGLDFITVYHMTKLKAERLHCLSLDCPTNGLLYSVYDNLLICHCIGERVSVVFDILSTTSRSQEGLASREKTHPLGTASAMYYLHRHRMSTATSASPRGSVEGRRSSVGQLRNSFTAAAAAEESPRVLSQPTAASKVPQSPAETEWGPLVTPQKHSSSRAAPSHMGPKKESDISNFDSLAFGGELAITASNGTLIRKEQTLGEAAQYMVLEVPEQTQEVYGTYSFEYLAPNRLLDQHRRLVWEIKCHLPGVVREMTQMAADSKEIPLFLSRRGMRFSRFKQVADGQLEYHTITREGRLAKQLMLHELRHLLLQQTDLTALRAYIRSLMRPYGTEYRRLVQVQFDVIHSAENLAAAAGAGVTSGLSSMQLTPGSNNSPTIFSISATTRRRVMAETLFRSASNKRAAAAGATMFGNNMGVYPGLVNMTGGSSPGTNGSAQDSDGTSPMDSDTLELPSVMQLLLPDISMVGVRARKLQFLQQRAQDTPNDTSEESANLRRNSLPGNNKIKPTCQAVVLNTRRDICGGLICTQAEILSHVWLPLLLHSDVDFGYLSCALAVFIAHLRESQVTVVPAFSAVLLNVLFHSSHYMEVSRLLQQRALPDSVELALYALEFCDMLADHIENAIAGLQNANSTEKNIVDQAPGTSEYVPLAALSGAAGQAAGESNTITPHDQLLRHRSALAVMRQCALDVLWRLDERVTVVKWHLSHGEVLRALAYCKKKGGQWHAPLLPGSIPGIDFFTAAINAVATLQGVSASVNATSPKGTPQKDARSSNRPDGEEGISDSIIPADKEEGADPKERQRAKDRRAAVRGASIGVFHAVYLFLREWDNAILLTTPTNAGKSRLATQVPFPDHLFDIKARENFRKMFGY